jgi:hypothetical protein
MIKTVVAYETYKMFAKRYGIRLTLNKKRKPIDVLRKEIRQYELLHHVTGGLYY